MGPRRLGFLVETPLDLAGWKVLDVTPDLPCDAASLCPADHVPLRTVCTLLAPNRTTRVRVGTCPDCGHTAYIDRPAVGWLHEFYRRTWDTATGAAQEESIERRARKLAALRAGVERDAIALAKALPLDRSRPVCEIGCGYGSSLKQLEQAGFSNLAGVETSEHRAEVARRAVDGEILTSPFEAPATAAALRARGPFALIYSIHAIEHTADPGAVIAAAAALQERDGYLILSVPNLEGEPTMSVVFFLPHLHTFTRESLVRLASRHGYGLVDDERADRRNLNLVFRKGYRGEAATRQERIIERTTAKFVRGLALREGGLGRRRLWWLKRSDRAGQIWWSGVKRLDTWRWREVARRHPDDDPRSLLVRALRRRYTDAGESPLEIQFERDVALFYK
jgi:2-polyprenyl-3-methyl-5-hydroxy-6-metoxy-1,4-benzoquinol methylase